MSAPGVAVDRQAVDHQHEAEEVHRLARVADRVSAPEELESSIPLLIDSTSIRRRIRAGKSGSLGGIGRTFSVRLKPRALGIPDQAPECIASDDVALGITRG